MFKNWYLACSKRASTLYNVAGTLFALAGLVEFAGRDKIFGAVWIALGAVFVSLGGAQKQRELP